MSERLRIDSAMPAEPINLGIGQPSADLLPVDLVRAASEDFFAAAEAVDLNYGEVQGDARFRASLAGLLTREHGHAVRPDALFLSAGSSQALDFVTALFTRPGDTVLVEEPSYFLAFQIFRDHGLNIVGIPMDGQGMDIRALESAVHRHRAKMVYTIPSFHNPTGAVLSRGRRVRLAELSLEHGFVVAADEVYQMLHGAEAPPPPMAYWAERGNVLSLGSFSKILAPGMRLGWIQANETQMEKLLSSGFLNSGGSINHFVSHLVRHAIDSGRLETFIALLRERYAARLDAMDQALREHLGDLATWARPGGGYFFWLTLPPAVDTVALRGAALAAGTGFQPGPVFSPNGGLKNQLRLSFAHYREDEIRTGIHRLAEIVRTAV